MKWVFLPFWVPHVPNQTMFIGKIATRQGTYDCDKPSSVAKSYPLGGTPKGPSPNSHETGPMERNIRCPVGSFATSWLQSCLRGVKTNHCFEHLCASHDVSSMDVQVSQMCGHCPCYKPSKGLQDFPKLRRRDLDARW